MFDTGPRVGRSEPHGVAGAESSREERLSWFREAKYGLFIHWGLYAIPAGEWQGRRIPGLGEWIMHGASIPVREYERLASQFDPIAFDADAWVALAIEAGMKYIVITAKHHDGFSLFRSTVSAFNVVDATPFKRDVLQELATACARRGMKLGFYYSQVVDWHEPNGGGNTWDFGPDHEKDYCQFLCGKSEPQLRELLTNYGPVAIMWFDSPRWMIPELGRHFVDIVRSIQPNTLINGRLGVEGDYESTRDNLIPPHSSTTPWECPATMNRTWGYRRDDTAWKTPHRITFELVDVVSKGGNYLLNVGPMANGTIPEESQNALRAVGRWLAVNGEAVYGAEPTPFAAAAGPPAPDYRVTSKRGKLYFTFFTPPPPAFSLPAMRNAVTRAYRLADRVPVATRAGNGRTVLEIACLPFDSITTVVVEIAGDTVEPVA